MKKLITIILVLAASVAFSQTTYQLNYDSIRVGKTAGNGATSLYGKTYLKNATEGAPSDSVLTVRNGRVYKIAGSAISSVGFLTYVFSRNASDISGYEQMPALTSYTAGAADTATAAATTTPAIIQEFATNTGFPNTTLIPAGVFNVTYQTQKNSGSQSYYTYAVIYKRNLAGTETAIATTNNSSSVSANTVQSVSVSAVSPTDISVLTTDRIVVKVFAVMVSGTANISIYYDDATDSRLAFPSALVDASNFVPYNGAVKDLVSAFSITGDSIKRVGGTGAQFLMGNGTVQDTTTIQTVANFFPKGDTRWAKSVTVQDSLNTRVKKSGDTMTGTLNAPDINLSGTLFGKRIDVRTGERLLLWNQTDGDYWSLKNNHDTLDFSKTFDRKAYMLQNGALVLGDNLSSTGLFLRTAPTTVSGNQYIAVRDSTNGLIKQMRSDGLSGFGTGYVRNQFSSAQPSSWFWISGYGKIDGRPGTYEPSLKIGTNSNIATQTGVSVNINYTPTNNETAHAFSDGSDYSIKGKAYNSLNLAPTFSGSDVSQVTDHYIGTQITPATIDTTRFDHVYGVEFQPYLTKASGNTIAGLHVGTIGGTWANKYAVKSDASDVDILIAGRSRSGGLNTSGNMVSTYSGTSPIITNTSGTTNVQYLDFANTGGRFWLGNNNSAGSSLPGSSAYATVLTTVGAQPLQFGTNGTIRQTISSSGDVTFTGDISANNLSSGTYTPTLTGITNISSSTSAKAMYTRIGNIVTQYGTFDVSPTAAGSASSIIDMDLNIASDLASLTDLSGFGQAPNSLINSIMISANTTTNRARIEFTSTTTSTIRIYYSFSYQIL